MSNYKKDTELKDKDPTDTVITGDEGSASVSDEDDAGFIWPNNDGISNRSDNNKDNN